MASSTDEVYEPYLHTALLEAGRASAPSISQHAVHATAGIRVAQGLFDLLVDTEILALAGAATGVLAPLMQRAYMMCLASGP